MSGALKVVAVCGSLQRPSRTLALVEAVLERLAQRLPLQVRLLELAEIGPALAGVLQRDKLPAAVAEQIAAIEGAELLIAASPVYRASYTGLFKHLFDFVQHDALKNRPVLLAASGGSERHALMIEHQLRPLFGFFQALSLPLGVYASESDFDDYQLLNPALHERIERALDPLDALFAKRFRQAAGTSRAVPETQR
ncbi:FMN reductase [Pseudomonas panipatensis]|uniref:FMN reductase n=1 Tax=Pseudomonas panipatensis TaxID=428992 RepID=A0A1G8MST7_9PSED|nr:FMN reductase [Pseudomonas panipatensis]SDI70992.1 FMN reductase [Pseudomonas panipatensis]SMP78215.1 FMN reductase [Pseudomonas panipatensis]